ncbi:MAG: tRNA (N6-threonylcarbamoyladenosine(37)-N6)-methyltransferase TrmO [Candidatus Omnitrophica bacterium]|nr:tRNA (N6-threonylcarbamoyladenosine(37)-N6)-methyltransferase TrmO [Candidatus Omnitrophota bacterium]
MDTSVKLKPIGIIHTPYRELEGIPIQSRFGEKSRGHIELFPEYRDGLKDVEGFSHLILIYHFNREKGVRLVGRPFLEDQSHGVFAMRSPKRPNPIGFSIVKLEKVDDTGITFSEVDMLDGTPLLDIKPYVSYFDSRRDVINGWIEKHFQDGKKPEQTNLES